MHGATMKYIICFFTAFYELHAKLYCILVFKH